MKTLEHYMDDPSVSHLQMPLREVKAIRLMIHDRTKDMTSAERVDYFNKSVEVAQEKYGFKFKVATDTK